MKKKMLGHAIKGGMDKMGKIFSKFAQVMRGICGVAR